MNTTETLTYRCPHCSAVMDVESQLIGENITCVDCGKPIHVEASQSIPVNESSSEGVKRHHVVHEPADEERNLQTMHPAMFRNHPFIYLVWRIKTMFVTLQVTTERCIFQRGLIARTTSEVRHDDVRNLQIDQSMFQRLFGVGTLSISSSGQDDFEIRAKGIPNPDTVVETIRNYQ